MRYFISYNDFLTISAIPGKLVKYIQNPFTPPNIDALCYLCAPISLRWGGTNVRGAATCLHAGASNYIYIILAML